MFLTTPHYWLVPESISVARESLTLKSVLMRFPKPGNLDDLSALTMQTRG